VSDLKNLHPSDRGSCSLNWLEAHIQFVEKHLSRMANWHHVISYVDVKFMSDCLNNIT